MTTCWFYHTIDEATSLFKYFGINKILHQHLDLVENMNTKKYLVIFFS